MHTTALPFQLGDPVEHRGIVVAPLFPLRDPLARYVTLETALARGLSIAETSEAGEVPELVVTNPLPDDILLYDGAEIVGAMQNRILNVSVLVAAGSTIRIPVSCTEQGRWRSISTTFSPAPHIANTELRRRKAAALAAMPLARGVAQRDVWESVRAQGERMGSSSPTGAHRDLFLARERELEALEPVFRAEPGQRGAVLGLGDACASTRSPGPTHSVRSSRSSAAATSSTRSSTWTGRRRSPSGCSGSSTRSRTRS